MAAGDLWKWEGWVGRGANSNIKKIKGMHNILKNNNNKVLTRIAAPSSHVLASPSCRNPSLQPLPQGVGSERTLSCDVLLFTVLRNHRNAVEALY